MFNDQPKKIFVSNLYDISSTPQEKLGALRFVDDGRVFMYARAGAVALVAGNLQQAAIPEANHLNCAVAAAAAIGDVRVSVTLGATAAVANLYQDGYLHVNDSVGVSHLYRVSYHPAIGSAGTGYVYLYDPIRVALTTASKVTLTKHPADSTIVCPTTLTGAVVGVAPMAVTIAYYYWMQIKGPCAVVVEGTHVIGNPVIPSTSAAGAVAPSAASNASLTPRVGTVMQVNATTKTGLINLNILGY